MLNNETLLKENAELKDQLLDWKNKYYSILEQFKLSQQREFASSSEKNIHQPDFFDEAGSQSENEESAEETAIVVPGHVRSKPKRRPLPENLPREIVIHDISEAEKICECGGQKERFGEEMTEQLEVVPPKLKVIQHIRPKYSCKQCQIGVSIAPMPPLLLPKSMATPSLVSFTLISKYVDHTPLYRQEGIWKRYGIDIARNTMCGWLMTVAELCEPLWHELRKFILSNDYIQADETPVQVMQEPGRKNTQKSFMWIYRGGNLRSYAVIYDYHETRAGECARQFLQGFKGYLQTDGYKGYDWTEKIAEITHLGCMAHARRPFANLVKMIKNPAKPIKC